MILEKITVGSYMSNCYIVGCEETKEAAVIDPGADFKKIDETIEELNVKIKFVILTHAHGDHIGALNEVIKKYNVPVYVHEDEVDMLQDANKNLSRMMFRKEIKVEPQKLLKDGEIIELGNLEMEIIHTPGHTKGSISIKVENIILTGDTLFNGSIGRTDFLGGSFEDIISSIKTKIFKYDDEVIVYPGHNSPTTIGNERKTNPFVI